MKLEGKNIAVICNYKLYPNRIGGMDRFYKAFDDAIKNEGGHIKWFFPSAGDFEFFDRLKIIGNEEQDVKQIFLIHQQQHQEQFDVIIMHFIELCSSFNKKIHAIGSPKIIAVDHNPRPLEGFPLKKRLVNRIKGLLYSKYVDLFVGVSKYTAHHIMNDYGGFLKRKTKVVYNGIKTDIYAKKYQENDFKFIVVSHLRPSKGIQDLIAAVGRMDRSLAEKISIDVYGKGDFQDRLEEMVSENKLESIFTFKGSSSELNTIYQRYAYMIQPTYMECFSLSILESLASNVPVITTQVGGNLEVIEDGNNGFIFNAGDIVALKNILEEIVKGNKEISNDVAQLVKSSFNLNLMVKNHLKLLEE